MGLIKSLKKRLGILDQREKFQPTADALSVYYPNSANAHAFPNLTFQSANRFPSQLSALLFDLGLGNRTAVVEAESFVPSATQRAKLLAEVFRKHGSDKHVHGYHFAYAGILETLVRTRDLRLLEIGLGTSDPTAVSTMGKTGRPGASLRAFHEYLPSAHIYGADIDRSTLFREDKIATAFVDQTVPHTFQNLIRDLHCSQFDLIIDDGLHAVEANLNTLRFALKHTTPGGWIVIEDIPERTLAVWHLVADFLQLGGIRTQIVRGTTAYLFLAHIP